MSAADAVERGRTAFSFQQWGEAYSQLSAADREAPLAPDDLDRLATASYLVGKEADSVAAWTRAYHELLDRGEIERAARCGFWLSHNLLLKGEAAQSRGWLARVQRLLDDRQLDCVERGYLLVVVGLYAMGEGDAASSYATNCQVAKIADRFGDPDLVTFGLLCRGKALIELGETNEAMGLLDEAIVAVAAREVSPIATGIVYCAAILACRSVFDLRRAHEWTAALSDWCDAQPDLVPFRGQCLVHRSEIMQLQGAWPDALREAQQACERLSAPAKQPALGMAYYQQGELHRLRGELAQAEKAYRQANEEGRQPQPGLAQLRLAQDRVDDAVASVRRVLDEADDHVARSKVLPAYVEIMLAARDVGAARAAADELADIAADLDIPLLRAVSAHATGAIHLAESDARAALAALRDALRGWQELDAPYEAARARVLIGCACREVGDADTGQMELDAARRVFTELGAAPDLARVDGILGRPSREAAGGLTRREIEVLALAAAGKTNHAIADELFISDKTVERHLSNIFTKLDVSNRAAATAYAYEHQLV